MVGVHKALSLLWCFVLLLYVFVNTWIKYKSNSNSKKLMPHLKKSKSTTSKLLKNELSPLKAWNLIKLISHPNNQHLKLSLLFMLLVQNARHFSSCINHVNNLINVENCKFPLNVCRTFPKLLKKALNTFSTKFCSSIVPLMPANSICIFWFFCKYPIMAWK